MRRKDMDKCTEVTEGKVIEIKNKGLDFPTINTDKAYLTNNVGKINV